MIAAVVVTALTTGWAGVRDLVSRIAMWRVRLRWWKVALSPVLLLLAATGVLWITGQERPAVGDYARFSGTPVLAIGVFAAITLAAAIGEEVGWRGFALPRLQRRFSPLIATLILASLWWLWHLQFFFAELTLWPRPPWVSAPGHLHRHHLDLALQPHRRQPPPRDRLAWAGELSSVSRRQIGDHQHLAHGTRRTALGPRTGGTAPCPSLRSGRRRLPWAWSQSAPGSRDHIRTDD